MSTYVIKRLLLMIPTLFGVSLVVWGVTAAAPEPPISSQLPSGIEQGKKAGESGTMNQALKVYRAQYGLDKPAILNFYYSLDTDNVRKAVLESATGGDGSPEERISRKLDAREQLIGGRTHYNKDLTRRLQPGPPSPFREQSALYTGRAIGHRGDHPSRRSRMEAGGYAGFPIERRSGVARYRRRSGNIDLWLPD